MEETYRKLRKYLSDKKGCIVCGKDNFSLWAKLHYLRALKCLNCGMVSVNPHISEEGLKIFYNTYFKNRLNNTALFEARKIMYKLEHEFISHFVCKGSVLDVGCSGGFFLNEFTPHAWRRKGVDVDRNAAVYAKANFGIDVLTGDFSKIDFKGEKFDLIVLRGVIEHCIDPRGYLKKCASILKHKGLLFISASPNIESFGAEIYREKWRLFTPIEHIHFFSINLLNRILSPLGLSLLERKYFYEETPYADILADYTRLKKDILLIMNGHRDKVKESAPFWGNMITGIWAFGRNINE